LTNYKPGNYRVDTRSVDSVVDDALTLIEQMLVVIDAAIPVGQTRSLYEKHDEGKGVFLLSSFASGKRLAITCPVLNDPEVLRGARFR
jgi:UDP-glucose 6-dehydrogenase